MTSRDIPLHYFQHPVLSRCKRYFYTVGTVPPLDLESLFTYNPLILDSKIDVNIEQDGIDYLVKPWLELQSITILRIDLELRRIEKFPVEGEYVSVEVSD